MNLPNAFFIRRVYTTHYMDVKWVLWALTGHVTIQLPGEAVFIPATARNLIARKIPDRQHPKSAFFCAFCASCGQIFFFATEGTRGTINWHAFVAFCD
jgi:hypothetical protein